MYFVPSKKLHNYTPGLFLGNSDWSEWTSRWKIMGLLSATAVITGPSSVALEQLNDHDLGMADALIFNSSWAGLACMLSFVHSCGAALYIQFLCVLVPFLGGNWFFKSLRWREWQRRLPRRYGFFLARAICSSLAKAVFGWSSSRSVIPGIPLPLKQVDGCYGKNGWSFYGSGIPGINLLLLWLIR